MTFARCRRALVACLLAAVTPGFAGAADEARSKEADRCVPQLEAGIGSVPQDTIRRLHVDLAHGISLMMLPGFAAAAYSISLAKSPDGKWSLSYVIDDRFSPARPYRAVVPFVSAEDARRLETVWAAAIAEATQAKPANDLGCVYLDGWTYVFSAEGRQASNFAGHGQIPRQLVGISDTLRIMAVDTRNTGHPLVSSLTDLQDRLDRIEGDLNMISQH